MSHGIVVLNAFFENVSRHRVEGRELAPGEKEENVMLEFRPRPVQDMLVACLWSRWSEAPGASRTAVVRGDHRRAAGRRSPRPATTAASFRSSPNIWMRGSTRTAKDLQRMQAILDDRERPYYEHRLAA